MGTKKPKACIICGNLFEAGREYICKRCSAQSASGTYVRKKTRKKRILVIDDEPMIVKMLVNRLQTQGYDVLTAQDGEEGYQKIKQERPDLIISDILMPKMSGYNLVEKLAVETDGTEKIPVIIITARGQMKELFNVWHYRYFLEKPFEPDMLLGKVKEILDGVAE